MLEWTRYHKSPMCGGDGSFSVERPETVDTLMIELEEYGVEWVKTVIGLAILSQASNNMAQHFKRQGFALIRFNWN